MEIAMDKRIILKIIADNPEVLKMDMEKIQRLFNEECYKKLERIRNLICDINLEERQCLNAIYNVLYE